MSGVELRPVSLKREGDGLAIEWSDGAKTFATWRLLRKSCPCASCLEARGKPPDPFRVLTPQEAAAGPPQPLAVRPIGHYAYQFTWNDGHDTGIYTLEALRQLGSNSNIDEKHE
jgi:DUF971 family protein